MIRGIHHVAVHVRDLDRMIKFYKDAFGFEVVGEEFSWRDTPWLDQLLDVPGSAARGAMLRAGSCYMELFEFSAPQPVSTRLHLASQRGDGQPAHRMRHDRGFRTRCAENDASGTHHSDPQYRCVADRRVPVPQ
jgi:catechol 2,3-dioxygenase-like lactoylglutathione lyase family enzyme